MVDAAGGGDPLDAERPGLAGGGGAIRQTAPLEANDLLGTDLAMLNSTLRPLLVQLDMADLERPLRD